MYPWLEHFAWLSSAFLFACYTLSKSSYL